MRIDEIAVGDIILLPIGELPTSSSMYQHVVIDVDTEIDVVVVELLEEAEMWEGFTLNPGVLIVLDTSKVKYLARPYFPGSSFSAMVAFRDAIREFGFVISREAREKWFSVLVMGLFVFALAELAVAIYCLANEGSAACR